MRECEGGVCAAAGFQAGAVLSGIKKGREKEDVAVIVSDCLCAAAGVYTTNRVKAAPVLFTRTALKGGAARAIIANSGNANACAPDGMENAVREAKAAAAVLRISAEQVLVASTGVIGQRLPVECIETALPGITLSYDGSGAAARAIMTTDTKEKTAAVQFTAGGKTCRLGGICKGSGMIHPNMGTMLAFITTDCAIAQPLLSKALKKTVKRTFNRVTVDGDTSTNDMCLVLANGMAGNTEIAEENEDYESFLQALHFVMETLAKKIAADGEGAERLMTCTVSGARDEDTAEALARAVCGSSLVKAAMFGGDANWGRVLCAMGYSGAEFDAEEVEVEFSSSEGTVLVCRDGKGVDFSEELAAKILKEDSVEILVTLKEGAGTASCWGCDLTYEYVKINGEYRT
jgi:glutamate N-acetyltransferase / amino-acid N-acetyltransferase